MASAPHPAPVCLGLDVHRDTVSVGILTADVQVPEVDKVAHDEASVRRLVGPWGAQMRSRSSLVLVEQAAE